MNIIVPILLSAALLFPLSGAGQTNPVLPQPLTPLREVMNPDGTINTTEDSPEFLILGVAHDKRRNGEPRSSRRFPRIVYGMIGSARGERASAWTQWLPEDRCLSRRTAPRGGAATRNLVRWDGVNWSASVHRSVSGTDCDREAIA